MSEQGIRLIVGLGNPGPEYQDHRHNVGAWFMAQLAQQQSVELKHHTKLRGATGKTLIANQPVHLFIPDTYMNESGRAVLAIAHYYKILPEHILIAHDELDFACGTVKLKNGGGHGGHNGLRDIIQCLHSKDFYRLRIGIDHPGHKDRVTGHVLNKPTAQQEQQIRYALDDALRTLDDLVTGQFERAFHTLHSEI